MSLYKINGIIIRLESKKPLKVTLEAGKQVFDLQGTTLEALFLDLKSVNLDSKTYLKIKKKLEYLYFN